MRGGIALLALAAIVTAGRVDTLAYFTDPATAQTGTLRTATITSQAQPTCNPIALTNNIRVSWTQVRARYEYVWNLYATGSSTSLATGTIGGGTAQGGTINLDLTPATYAVNGNYTLVVQARLVSPNTWVAASPTSTLVRRTSFLTIGTMSCGNA